MRCATQWATKLHRKHATGQANVFVHCHFKIYCNKEDILKDYFFQKLRYHKPKCFLINMHEDLGIVIRIGPACPPCPTNLILLETVYHTEENWRE